MSSTASFKSDCVRLYIVEGVNPTALKSVLLKTNFLLIQLSLSYTNRDLPSATSKVAFSATATSTPGSSSTSSLRTKVPRFTPIDKLFVIGNTKSSEDTLMPTLIEIEFKAASP